MEFQGTIGVIGAMDEEIELLKREIAPVKDFEEGGSIFYSGKREGMRIVLLKCGIGKVNAAIGTTLLISRFQPDYVINTGTAGALQETLSRGDTVISTRVVHHDVDATAFGYAPGQVPRMPDYYTADPRLVELAQEASLRQKGGRVICGIIATGDSFMSDREKTQRLRDTLPAAAAVEMEAAAVAQVCYQFSTPFVIIRSISDLAGDDSAGSFSSFLHSAAETSASLVIRVVERLSLLEG
ncbi:MAG: 5'-methylthioadenosine/adenosylhomocysteine nucleosidase [Spirochaetales bacterium]|nr:5'-methylthioadenosine/adenosylhomocysteine nucleosidase [Spirochaetales bacterium]